MALDVFVHRAAINESSQVGPGTRIWAFAHVLEGAVIGRDCNVGDHAFVEGGAVVGRGVTIKNGVAIWKGVTIRDYVFLGPYVVFTNDRHPRSPRAPFAGDRYHTDAWLQPTLIEEGVAIGANATILCGLTVGAYALVAAGAVVVGDVPPFTLVAGNPAKAVGSVCMCGNRLAAGGEPRCDKCHRQYETIERTLKLKGGLPS